jgi:hypothetical protein
MAGGLVGWCGGVYSHLGDLSSSLLRGECSDSTGQESPAVAFDVNDVLYVFWRGLNEKNRPVIFARAFATENSKVTQVTSGWSRPVELDDPNASNLWWPSVADVKPRSRVVGVDVVWEATIGKQSVIEYSHVTYP